MNNFPNYEIKTSDTFNSWPSFKDNKNKIPIYQLSDGSIILFSAVLGGYSSLEEPCARYIGGDPGFIASGVHKGWGTGCYALIDVNGVSKPNKEVKCTRGTNKLSTMEAGNCIVESKDMGDIFPIIIMMEQLLHILPLPLMLFQMQNRKIRGFYLPSDFYSYL